MNSQLFKKTVLLWFIFVPVAILNGTARNYLYQPLIDDLLAHQISTVIGSALFIATTCCLLKKEATESSDNELLLAGGVLVLATILFEFGFGHYIVGHPWSRLFADYNLLQGRIWSLFLLISFFSPLLVKKTNKQ